VDQVGYGEQVGRLAHFIKSSRQYWGYFHQISACPMIIPRIEYML